MSNVFGMRVIVDHHLKSSYDNNTQHGLDFKMSQGDVVPQGGNPLTKQVHRQSSTVRYDFLLALQLLGNVKSQRA